MAVTNPDKVVTKQDLADFYQSILPYLGGNIPVLGTIDRSDIYSTTEKVVGCWTDGRPLYQKTFTGTLNNTSAEGTPTETYVDIGSSVGVFVDIFGCVINSANAYQIITTIKANSGNAFVTLTGYPNTFSTSANRNKIDICNCRLTAGTNTYIVTARYTKTTDAANSYNYASENDYSTTEKIIGTWTSGATLYQKTYTLNFSVTSTSTWQSFNVASISGIWIKEFSGYIDRNDDLIVPCCCDVDDGAKYSVRTNSSNTAIKFTAYTTGSVVNASGTLYLTIKYTKS